MAYATIADLEIRIKRKFSDEEKRYYAAMLEDAAVIVDAYNKCASDEAKELVSCNMIIRAAGTGDALQVPIGTTQGTVSALGYSQTWTMGSGSTGEMYLTKLDKKLLCVGSRIGMNSPLEDL